MGVGMNYPALKFSPIPVPVKCRSKMAEPSPFTDSSRDPWRLSPTDSTEF